MKAHDVRHLVVCKACDGIGDGRKMLRIDGGLMHDHCVVKSMTEDQVLALPADERGKITLGAAGLDLMRKLMQVAA